jgi:hypothetical protein
VGHQRITLVLESAQGKQAFIPAMLQLTSDKAVVGVDRVVLTARAGGLIPRLLDREPDGT